MGYILVDYNFQIIYCPGKENRKADILSRHYGVTPVGGGAETQILLPEKLFASAIAPDQEINNLIGEAIYEDPWSKEILQLFHQGKLVEDWELREGLLWFKGKIFVPKDETI